MLSCLLCQLSNTYNTNQTRMDYKILKFSINTSILLCSRPKVFVYQEEVAGLPCRGEKGRLLDT
jgi:hypothetical protein